MNWQHLRTIVWLRGRLLRNWLRRSGMANTVVTTILLCLALLASVGLFFVALFVGVAALPKESPQNLLILWNVLIAAFLFFWTMGLLTELQRSEVISLEKLLYLPISLAGTYLVNYLSSFVSVTLVVFVPAMVGLCIASVVAMGPAMLVTFPLLAGLVLLVTAVTYQLRGWLAALMTNKRHRRTLVAAITAGFIVLSQLPNLFNAAFLRSRARDEVARSQEYFREIEKLGQLFQSHQIDFRQYSERREALDAQKKAASQAAQDQFDWWIRAIDLILPPGWMAYGAMAAARHSVWPGLLGSAGLFLIGGASLRRSYRMTVRFYRGDYESGKRRRKTAVPTAPVPTVPFSPASSVAPSSMPARRAALLVEKNVPLPWVGEQAAATALATLRSLLRAPELKMALLSTLMIGVVALSTLVAGRRIPVTEGARPLLALGIIVTEMLSLTQILQNQFGFDRSGFRTFVLSPSNRKDILLGKNLGTAPLAIGAGGFALVLLEVLYPLTVTHFLASLIQLFSAYLILCLFGNQTSILVPTAVRSGSLRASATTTMQSLLRLLAGLGVMVALCPLMIPLGVDWLIQNLDGGLRIPVYLTMAALELFLLVLLYRVVLAYQGTLLQAREQRILEAVTTKND